MPAPASFPTVDPFLPKTQEGVDRHLRQIANVTRGIMDGKINAAFDVILEVAPAVETVVLDERIGTISRIILTAADDVAATHLASGTVVVLTASITTGQFTISHLPSPLARSFRISFLS